MTILPRHLDASRPGYGRELEFRSAIVIIERREFALSKGVARPTDDLLRPATRFETRTCEFQFRKYVIGLR